jgi:hypothetical protein
MPIAPELRHHYEGPEWEAARSRVLDRAQHCCERCGVPNDQLVERCHGWWWDERAGVWIVPGRQLVDGRPPAERGIRIDYRLPLGLGTLINNTSEFVRIVLTIAHLNHTPGDDRLVNLAAWCQWCHLDYDMEKHAQTRAERKDQRRPLLTAAQGTTHQTQCSNPLLPKRTPSGQP